MVAVETEPELRVGSARTLFENPVLDLPGSGAGGSRHYDVARDGERFVMLQSEGDLIVEQPRIVLNWFEELERLTAETQ